MNVNGLTHSSPHKYLPSALAFVRASMQIMVLVAVLLVIMLSEAHALRFKPRMDQAQWITQSDVLNCQMIQPIPDFGRAVFDTTAGGTTRFYLDATSNPFAQGQAALRSNAPTWNPELTAVDLGLVKVRTGPMPVELEASLSTQLLAELYKGKSPEFVRRAWFADDEPISVAMSSVTFRDAYLQYQQCLAQLSPVGFDKLERSRVHFETDRYRLTPQATQWLNTLLGYLHVATDVNQLYIDGHTDNRHSTSYNIELSRRRAEAVMKYLTDRGIPAEKITLRYHGERYPVKPNNNAENMRKNRRVTLRVERIKPTIASR